MISSLKQISFKFLKSNRRITLSCITVIAIVTFLMCSLINFAFNSEKNLKNQSKDVFGDFQLQIGYSNNINNSIDSDSISEVNSIKGVTKTSLALVGNVDINNSSIYTLGLENDELSKSKYHYSSNLDSDSAVVNKTLAEYLKLSVGDSIKVNNQDKTIVEIFDDKLNAGSSINILILDRNILKEILKVNNEATFIMVRADKDEVKNIADILSNKDKNLRVEMPEENEFETKNVNTLKYFIMFIGVLVFIMCGLFVVASMQQFIYKYTKDFAIMKAIGADSYQVLKIVFFQTIFINITGILSGIVLTILSVVFFLRTFTINIVPMLKISLIGFIICQVILFIPAIKTARILPVKAIQKNENRKSFKKKNKYIIILILIGMALVGCSIILNDINSFLEGIGGYLIILIGCFLLITKNIEKIMDILFAAAKKYFGITVQLAVKTMKSQLKKCSIIVIAISMAMVITTIGGSFMEMIKESNNEYYRSEYLADIELQTNSSIEYNESEEMIKEIKELANTQTLAFYDLGDVCYYHKSKSKNVYCSVIDMEEMKDFNFIKSFDGNKKDKVVISEPFAKDNNINIGDTISIKDPELVNQQAGARKSYNLKLQVIDIVPKNISNGCDILVDKINYSKMINYDMNLNKLYINSSNSEIENRLKEIKTSHPSIKWSTLDEVLKASEEAISIRWKYFNVALMIIVITTIFGMVNAIKNNVNSNRKEYAVLRSMKFTDKDLRKMIYSQVAIFLGIGEFTGLVLGYAGSWIIVLSDKIAKAPFNYKLIGLNIIISIFICIIYLLPFIRTISKERIVRELNQDEL